MISDVLLPYALDPVEYTITPHGNGLINKTWYVQKNEEGNGFILQLINEGIFKQPEDIAFNIRLVSDHLKKYYPGYLFAAPLQTMDGEDMVRTGDGYFRMFPFITGSHTIEVVNDPLQAYEAAKQFGAFTKRLSGINTFQLKNTLPHFHDLARRFRDFERALLSGNPERTQESSTLIDYIHLNKNIVNTWEELRNHIPVRCVHHDTKISNVLFDANDKGLCVIDLDTIMPGYFISDIGDMFRTYLSPVTEEDRDMKKIEIRKEYYDAIVQGYLLEMGESLTQIEKDHFLFAGKVMIYMQAIRFLTDYINDDVYYGSEYEGHNFIRAGNQAILLGKLIHFENTI